MSDYDFKTLNDKEFEVLCTELLGSNEDTVFERFKAGRDGGIDGRYFTTEGNQVILQCKHWSGTSIAKLIYELKNKEKLKVDKLAPHRYLLAISNPLSPADKHKIFHALAPHIKSESDIHGKESLNDLIAKNPAIERRHYKLWLQSSNVLSHIINNAIFGRSAFSVEEIINSSAKYVVTSNHNEALKLLENLRVLIISGEPGVGKTTLADHLCLHYLDQGFQFIKISEDIREAEAVFDSESKQIIYFDDFLGRNYLEALNGHEGNQIAHFIRRVATNKNKRFILTSRSTILNQGWQLIDTFEHINAKKNQYELLIKSLTSLDKAHILYSHIWHSGLPIEYVDQLYAEKRYNKIIHHKNFNPRLINYITDSTKLESCLPASYWAYIEKSLNNPSQIWENPFIAQLDDFGRAIVKLLGLNGSGMKEKELSEAYQKYITLPENSNFHGRREFQANIRVLTGSFITRKVSLAGLVEIDLFNPSISDYVLKRFAKDLVEIRLAMISLKTLRSTITLRSFMSDDFISKVEAKSICELLFEDLSKSNFKAIAIDYISALLNIYKLCQGFDSSPSHIVTSSVTYLLNNSVGAATNYSYEVINDGAKAGIVTYDQAAEFLSNNFEVIYDYSEMRASLELLHAIPDENPQKNDLLIAITKHILEVISENLFDFIDVNDAFSKVGYDDYASASDELRILIEQDLDNLGIEYSSGDVDMMLDSFDVRNELNRYFENSAEHDFFGGSPGGNLSIDKIDDLFDRT
jgi:adenylate kinase family enzyme